MINLAAIDQAFLTRFAFALCFYWAWGIFAKGIFEPIQAQIGQNLARKFNKKTQKLQSLAKQTCSEIDDFFINHLADGAGRLDRLVNGADLESGEQQKFKELILENYQFSVLLDKLGE